MSIKWFEEELELLEISLKNGGSDTPHLIEAKIKAYKDAIKALSITEYSAFWMTYYPDDPNGDYDTKVHSHSGAKSCAKRIAGEIGGYIIPVYYGHLNREEG